MTLIPHWASVKIELGAYVGRSPGMRFTAAIGSDTNISRLINDIVRLNLKDKRHLPPGEETSWEPFCLTSSPQFCKSEQSLSNGQICLKSSSLIFCEK